MTYIHTRKGGINEFFRSGELTRWWHHPQHQFQKRPSLTSPSPYYNTLKPCDPSPHHYYWFSYLYCQSLMPSCRERMVVLTRLRVVNHHSETLFEVVTMAFLVDHGLREPLTTIAKRRRWRRRLLRKSLSRPRIRLRETRSGKSRSTWGREKCKSDCWHPFCFVTRSSPCDENISYTYTHKARSPFLGIGTERKVSVQEKIDVRGDRARVQLRPQLCGLWHKMSVLMNRL